MRMRPKLWPSTPLMRARIDLYGRTLATWRNMKRTALVGFLLAQACAAQNGVTGSIDPGDNFVAPDLALDESFFYCRIQPAVIEQHGCVSGQSGESGSCHDSRSAMRLATASAPAMCDATGRVIGDLPDAYVANFETVQYFVQSDPLTSPFYLRPLNLTSHPRRIFTADDPAAKLIEQWISSGAR